jgi:uncharacterized protein (TIGR03086 family)
MEWIRPSRNKVLCHAWIMGTLLGQYEQALDEFDARLRKVGRDQWSLPTPCTRWDVRALVAHVVDEQRWAPYLLSGGQVSESGERFRGDPLGGDPLAAWTVARSDAMAAFTGPRALEQPVSVSTGATSARDYLWEMTVDLAIHAWDLARAVGADERLNPELVRRICAEAEKNLEDMARSGLFDPPVSVPAHADLQARTLALFGRRT